MTEPIVGTKEASELLLKDLFVDLRSKVNYWASYTCQTPQARMGYIGQHLVSVVTGFKGGKSGARGYDLVLSNNEYGEIKTCTRIDQLGMCKECHSPISSLEYKCPICDGQNIIRKDDSKWLIDVRNEKEVPLINNPKFYYFVLFEFEDITIPNSDILITIYRVDPKCPGFTLCMLDYWFNIKKQTVGKAPFNMWPHMLKFHLTKPEIIYKTRITNDNQIITEIFNNDNPETENINIKEFLSSKNFDETVIINTCKILNITIPQYSSKKDLLKIFTESLINRNINNSDLADAISYAMYIPRLIPFIDDIPDKYELYFKKYIF